MNHSHTRRTFLAGTAAAAGALSMPAIVKAQTTTLKISHYLPPTHGFQTDLLGPWAQGIKEKSNGAVDFQIYDVSSAFGRADRQADQVRAGVTDIALGLAGIPRGRFPHTSIIELPFVVEKAGPGSKALWEVYKEGKLGREYDDYKVLLLMTHHGALLHTVERPIRQLDDVKGLRVRSPGPAINAMLEFLGASAIGMPPAQIYESLEKGALDGLATTWDLVSAIRANEVLKYHTDCRLYAAAFYIVMNKQSYARLPQEVQTLIDETTGEAMLAHVNGWWDKWDAAGKADAVKRNQEIITIDNATRDQWREQLQPMISKYLAGLKNEGVENPEALYETMLDLVQKYSA